MSNYLPLIVRDVLTKTGWTENELAVYSTLLEKGAMNLTDLSQETSIAISSLQYVLKKLGIKKMISKSMMNEKPLYAAANVEQLRKWTKGFCKQYLQFEDVVGKFIDQYDFNPQIYTPKVRFYEGVKGVKQLFRNILKECDGNKDELLSLFSVEDSKGSKFDDFFQQEYIPSRIKKKIPLKNIALETEESLSYLKSDKSALRETKVIEKGFFPKVDSEIAIYKDFLSCMSSNKEGDFAVTIKDKALVSILRSIFDMLWFSADKFQFYDGEDGIKRSYMKMLEGCRAGKIRCFYSVIEEQRMGLQKYLENEYTKKRIDLNVKSFNLALDEKKARRYKSKDDTELRETKLISKKYFPEVNAEINLYDNKMHCMSFDDEHAFAFIVQDSSIISILVGIFDFLWDNVD